MMVNDSLLLPHYRLGAALSSGRFGTVRLAEDLDRNRQVAVKLIPKQVMEVERREAEILNHSTLHHEHVLEVFDVIETEDLSIIVLEYAEGGDLFDYIVRHIRVPENEARQLFRQVLDAVAYCHEHGVAHRDLKPENICLDAENRVKLADFGLSAQIGEGHSLTDSVGSPNYAAPELLRRGSTHDGRQVDAWSLGVVLYALLVGSLPFDSSSLSELFRQIRAGRYHEPGYLSHAATDLIRKALTVDPADRISVAEMRQHPWLSNDTCPVEPAPEPEMKVEVVCAFLASGGIATHLMTGGGLAGRPMRALKKHAATCPGRLMRRGPRRPYTGVRLASVGCLIQL